MCGAVPYGEDLEDPFEIYKTIMKEQLKFPSIMKDKIATNLIIKLLNKTPTTRHTNYAALKAHY